MSIFPSSVALLIYDIKLGIAWSDFKASPSKPLYDRFGKPLTIFAERNYKLKHDVLRQKSSDALKPNTAPIPNERTVGLWLGFSMYELLFVVSNP